MFAKKVLEYFKSFLANLQYKIEKFTFKCTQRPQKTVSSFLHIKNMPSFALILNPLE
jgi:hypothetical protein